MILRDTLIVTATLGQRQTLERTIKSVQKIGGSRVRHIVIAPEGVCSNLRRIYSDIEIIPEPQNCKGIYVALNYALKLYAKDHKYLSFINDDDFWLPDYNKLFGIMDQHNDIGVVYGRVNYIDQWGNFIGEQTSSARYKAFKSLLTQKIILFTQQATLIKSEVFLKLGGFDESYKLIADTKFWLKAIEINTKFHYSNSICAGYTIQDDQLSSDGKLQNEEHKRLSSEIIQPNYILSIGEKFLFRIVNIKIYLNRFLMHRKVSRMHLLFHKKMYTKSE